MSQGKDFLSTRRKKNVFTYIVAVTENVNTFLLV